MNEDFAIQLFEGKKVRIVWDAEQEKYSFSTSSQLILNMQNLNK